MTNCRGFAGEAGSHHQLESSAVKCCVGSPTHQRCAPVQSAGLNSRKTRLFVFQRGAAMSKDFVQRQCCRSWHGFRRRMAKARIAKRARSTCRHVTNETEIFLRSCDAKEQTLPYSICT